MPKLILSDLERMSKVASTGQFSVGYKPPPRGILLKKGMPVNPPSRSLLDEVNERFNAGEEQFARYNQEVSVEGPKFVADLNNRIVDTKNWITNELSDAWETAQNPRNIVDMALSFAEKGTEKLLRLNEIPLANNAGVMIKNAKLQKILNKAAPWLKTAGNIVTLGNIGLDVYDAWNETKDQDIASRLAHTSLAVSEASVKALIGIPTLGIGNLFLDKYIDSGFTQFEEFLQTDNGLFVGNAILNSVPAIGIPMNIYEYNVMRDAGMTRAEALDYAVYGYADGRGPVNDVINWLNE